MENAQCNVVINILSMKNICLFIRFLVPGLHHWYRIPKEGTLSHIIVVLSSVNTCLLEEIPYESTDYL